ncbi:MAG: adventurous gliding motility protein CglF [Myxococcota bacterium]
MLFRLVRMVVVFTALGSARGYAQDEEVGPNDTVIYQQKTVVSFDDDTIDGDLTRPDGAYIETRKRIRHSSLIRIRDNFRAQILRSVISL